MSKIEFISHDSFPDDEYTKELVYLCLDGKYRIAYVRKSAKNGGMFWGVASIGATRNGAKEFFPAFLQDSNFLEKDIKDFLDKRKWESGTRSINQNHVSTAADLQAAFKQPANQEVVDNDELPF